VARVTGPHSDIGPELRALAQAVLDRLDPAVRAAAAMASAAGNEPGKCQQVWCPVCALAALANGEQHLLLTVVAEHSVALLTLIRTMTGDGSQQGGPDDSPTPDDDGPDDGRPTQGRYQHIAFTVEE
jgi:hypothetical protein